VKTLVTPANNLKGNNVGIYMGSCGNK